MLVSRAGRRLLGRVKVLFNTAITDFLLGGYRKLPKGRGSYSSGGSETIFMAQNDETDGHRCDAEKGHAQSDGTLVVGSFLNFGNIRNGKVMVGNKDDDGDVNSVAMRKAESIVLFEKRLKEMVMEHNDPQDWLDIHEFLHYYSRLTSPLYIDMVHKFFADICGNGT